LQNDSQTIEVRRGFGLLFISVSIAVGVASVLSEVVFVNKAPLYYYAIIWFASFAITFGLIFSRFRTIIPSIRSRMKYSIKWSADAKALNGLCWAGPFAAIPVFPSLYQFLILLGIGLGNFSTYVLMKKYSRLDNREQMIVALISLASIPIAWEIDLTLLIARHDIAVMLSRILISTAYGTGGIYALLKRDK
jgi:hypothetical protein